MDKEFTYTHRKSKRARRLRLTVSCDGGVVLTSPFGIRASLIEKFISDKKQWIFDKIKFFKSTPRRAVRIFSPRNYLENKEKAFALVTRRIQFYNQAYDFSFNKIFIKNQKSRWGSCSRNKNLNFNYKILFLPPIHQDYIIAHELCHLKEFNHSMKFWALVGKIIPNYFEIKKELRKHELLYR